MARRGGRRRRQGPREPSGRVSRRWAADMTEREAMSVVIDARMRHYGLTEDDARKDMAGTGLGRLLLWEAISRRQFEAGQKFGELFDDYLRATMAPSMFPRSPQLEHRDGHFGPGPVSEEGAAEAEWAIRVIERYNAALAALREADRERAGRATAAAFAVYEMAVLDGDADQLSQWDLGELRVGLNALVRHFGIAQDVDEAA